MTVSRPTDRYPDARRMRRPRSAVIAVTLAAVVLGLAIAYVGYRQFGPQELEGEQVTYNLVDESTLEITMAVTRKDPSRAAVCILRARSADGTETGRREVYVAPSTSGTVQIDTIVKTTARPAVGEVYGCSFDVPSYLRTS
ncbi:MAG TPA: DUF4307 domain-containing protein [Aldersonia sp.]